MAHKVAGQTPVVVEGSRTSHIKATFNAAQRCSRSLPPAEAPPVVHLKVTAPMLRAGAPVVGLDGGAVDVPVVVAEAPEVALLAGHVPEDHHEVRRLPAGHMLRVTVVRTRRPHIKQGL